MSQMKNIWVRKHGSDPVALPFFVFFELLTEGKIGDPDQYSERQNGPWEHVSLHPAVKNAGDDKRFGEILGLKGKVTISDVRKAYFRQMSLYHPDKVAHLGPKLRELAEKETKDINEAYAYFQERYG